MFLTLHAAIAYPFDADAFWGFLFRPSPLILTGLVLTVIISIISQALGSVLGFFAATGRKSEHRIWRGIASFYVWVFRGTPFLVQVSIIYFAGFPFFGLAIFGGYRWDDISILGFVIAGRVLAGIFALSLNEGAYMAEIVRSGLEAVDKGQSEAAQAVGMRKKQVMNRIILPQAMRTIIPPLGNQFNNMLKNTSLLSVISVVELYTAAQIIQGQTFQPFEIFGAVAIYYLALTSVWNFIQMGIEKRLNRGWGGGAAAATNAGGVLSTLTGSIQKVGAGFGKRNA